MEVHSRMWWIARFEAQVRAKSNINTICYEPIVNCVAQGLHYSAEVTEWVRKQSGLDFSVKGIYSICLFLTAVSP